MRRMEADSWENARRSVLTKAVETKSPAISECDRVPFEPSIEVQPTTRSAESPSGLDVSLVVPQSWENQFTISTANLKDTSVTLPEGYTANPSLASGLGCVHAATVSKRKRLLRCRGRLSAGIEDRYSIDDRNAVLQEKISRRDLYSDTV